MHEHAAQHAPLHIWKVLYEVHMSFALLLHISLGGEHGDPFFYFVCGVLFVIWLAGTVQVIDSQESF